MTQMAMTEMAVSELTMSELTGLTEAPAPTAAKPTAPSIHRRVILTWIAVYPTITIIQSLLGTHVAGYPLPVRTLLVTALVAPLVVYLVLPTVMKAHTGLLRRLAGRRISG
jgi:antibiotic biosynthesis monooxygenase (ABM) superfamily enzyme